MVGNSNTVRVVSEVIEYVLGAAEGSFGVHDPSVTPPAAQQLREGFGGRKRFKPSGKLQLAGAEGVLKGLRKLPAEDFAKDLDGEEEASITRAHPPAVVGRQSACGHHAMHMRMVFEFLIPRVQHAEEADFGAEAPRVTGYLEQGIGADAQQQVV